FLTSTITSQSFTDDSRFYIPVKKIQLYLFSILFPEMNHIPGIFIENLWKLQGLTRKIRKNSRKGILDIINYTWVTTATISKPPISASTEIPPLTIGIIAGLAGIILIGIIAGIVGIFVYKKRKERRYSIATPG
ncbi:17141_t:CDS:2, partial [Dentiscutata erythropus]